MPDLIKQRRRSQFEAWLLAAGADDSHATWGERKEAVIGAMRGTVVEFGPGTGVNMRYYAPGTKVIAIEPNPVMHERLQAEADRHDVDLEIRQVGASDTETDSDIADESVDGVVATLLLCGVDDPARVVEQAHRMLRPGGTYFFLEHVASPGDSANRHVQRLLRRPHRWLFNGCDISLRTADILRASSFSAVDVDEVDRGRQALWVRHQIVGTATK